MQKETAKIYAAAPTFLILQAEKEKKKRGGNQ
jgi:hypothetical protein